jgi:hypothetical protein
MNKELTAESIEQESVERKCNRVLKPWAILFCHFMASDSVHGCACFFSKPHMFPDAPTLAPHLPYGLVTTPASAKLLAAPGTPAVSPAVLCGLPLLPSRSDRQLLKASAAATKKRYRMARSRQTIETPKANSANPIAR